MPIHVEPGSFGVGGVVAFLLTSVVAVTGYLIKRSTAIDTSKIDDRGKFTQDLMSRYSEACSRLDECEEAQRKLEIQILQLNRLLGVTAAELRAIVGNIDFLLVIISMNQLDLKTIHATVGRIKDGINNLANRIDRDQVTLSIQTPTVIPITQQPVHMQRDIEQVMKSVLEDEKDDEHS